MSLEIAILFLLQTAMAPALAQPQAGSQTPENPNIVLIFMDNYGWGEPGVYGGGILRGAPTPNIEQLASQGMQLLVSKTTRLLSG